MTQLISNVLMQPKPTEATERLTLVEKLENYRDTQTDFEATFADAVIDVCIDIVKQHSNWVSFNDKLPKNLQRILVCFKEKGIISGTWFADSKNPNDGFFCSDNGLSDFYRLSDNTMDLWQPIQPPSEPQYLISKGGYWYRPNAKGYTASKHEAGRFSKEFAERHAKEVPEVRIFEDKENR